MPISYIWLSDYLKVARIRVLFLSARSYEQTIRAEEGCFQESKGGEGAVGG